MEIKKVNKYSIAISQSCATARKNVLTGRCVAL